MFIYVHPNLHLQTSIKTVYLDDFQYIILFYVYIYIYMYNILSFLRCRKYIQSSDTFKHLICASCLSNQQTTEVGQNIDFSILFISYNFVNYL